MSATLSPEEQAIQRTNARILVSHAQTPVPENMAHSDDGSVVAINVSPTSLKAIANAVQYVEEHGFYVLGGPAVFQTPMPDMMRPVALIVGVKVKQS